LNFSYTEKLKDLSTPSISKLTLKLVTKDQIFSKCEVDAELSLQLRKWN